MVVEGVVEKDSYFSDKNKTTYKMIAQRILSFDQARKEYIKYIKLSINNEIDDVALLTSKLKEMSSTGSGSPVVISYTGKEAAADIELPKEITINITDKSFKGLQALCGKAKVDLVYYARPNLH